MDDSYHYPPDLLNLLIDTIPCLCKSKLDVVLFFRGAGVSQAVLAPFEAQIAKDRNAIKKHEIARAILSDLNERGDATLRVRREVVKRVVEFEDFSACWPEDQIKAKAFIGDIRRLVNVKDSFTRMNQERESEKRKQREERETAQRLLMERKKALAGIKDELFALFPMKDTWARGKKLEAILNRLFTISGIAVREAFTLKGDEGTGIVEQIDGVVQIDGALYLVEMKWWAEPLGPGDVAQHQVRVFNRSQSRGFFISASGYTEAAIQTCRTSLANAVFVLCELEEFVRILDADTPLLEVLRVKIQAAILDKQPLHRVG
ncbi:MAG: restriction endonuclease [Oligoflexia bacterium]|nr:restriction endonuclease [Oligoflexia bacterium]